MALLGVKNYDPAGAVNKVATSLLAMTALDTTNLRITFTAPANGSVLVKMRGVIHGATTYPQIYLGVLESSPTAGLLRGRMLPMGALKTTALATAQLTAEAIFVVSGLTPGNSYTWDAAYGVDVVAASTGLKYGGPNNTTTNDAFGAFSFSIHSTPGLLASVLYDPGNGVQSGSLVTTKSVASLLAMTVLDSTNLRCTFTAPASGSVSVRIRCSVLKGFPTPQILLGVIDSGATLIARHPTLGGYFDTAGVATRAPHQVQFEIDGLTPGNSYSWDAAYGVEIVSGAGGYLGYGGPNDTTSDNSAGAFAMDVWTV